MGEILGNPGILGQGGYLVHPRMLPGRERNPRILGQGGYLVHPILGCSWDLGIPGYLDKGGI